MSVRVGYLISAVLAVAGIATLFAFTAGVGQREGLSLWVPSTWLVAVVAVALLVRVLANRPLRVLLALGSLGLCVIFSTFLGLYLLPAALALLVVTLSAEAPGSGNDDELSLPAS